MGVTLEDMDRLFGDVPLHTTDEESSLVPSASEVEPPKLKSPRSLSPSTKSKSKSWFGGGATGRETTTTNRANYQSVNAHEEGEEVG